MAYRSEPADAPTENGYFDDAPPVTGPEAYGFAGFDPGEPPRDGESCVDGKTSTRNYRFKLVPFKDLKPDPKELYRVKGIIPHVGVAMIWGPSKCGKSFWTFDISMHVALGWMYRDHRVQQGPVVYC